MVFTSIKEIVKAIKEFPTSDGGKRVKYPVLFKKAVCEFIIKKETTPTQLTSSVRMTAALMNRWMHQYQEGLYTMEGAYNVSKTSLTSNQKVLAQLNTEVNLLERKIELIKQCEELGIQIQT